MAKNIKVVPSLGIIQLSGSNANTSISVTDDGQLQFGESSNTGSLNVTGDLVVQGSVTAQEFKTEFVSASIIYRSGSTKFGDTADDIHAFTGSLELSGSATINAGTNTNSYFFAKFRNSDDEDVIQFRTNGSADFNGSLKVNSTNNLGRVTVNPTTDSADAIGIDERGFIAFADSGTLNTRLRGLPGSVFQFQDNAYNTFFNISKNSATYLNTSGNFGIGTATPSVKFEVSGSVKIDKGTLTIDGETHSRIYLQNPGGSGDSFIAWYDSNGSYDWYLGQTSENGSINLYNYTAGGTHTTFSTNGETYFNLGRVGIGTTNPVGKLEVSDNIYIRDVNGSPFIALTEQNSGQVGTPFYIQHSSTQGTIYSTQPLRIYGGTVRAIDIDSSGRVGIGTTSPTQALTVAGNILQTSNANFIGTRKIIGRDSNGLDLMDDSGANGISIKDGGNVQFTDYGSGNNTGTAAYRLSVDSSGNIIEESLGAGAVDGLGSGGYITRWEDTDTITSSSIYENNGNIGIGTTSPGRKLHVSIDVNDEVARFTSTAGNDAYIELSNANSDGYSKYGVVYNDFVFIPSGSETVRFTDEGRVGIGTSNPQLGGTSGIDIYDTSYPQVRLHNSNTGTSVSDGFLIGLTATTVELKNYENTPIDISTNSQTRMRITGDGNVGIGTTSPQAKLDVSGSAQFYSVDIFNGDQYANPRLRIGRSTAETLNFDVDDYVARIYHKQDETGTQVHKLNLTVDSNSTGGSEINLGFRDSDGSNESTKLIISSSGNVGVGTTTPQRLLDVNGDVRVKQNIFGAGGNYVGFFKDGGAAIPVKVGSLTISNNYNDIAPSYGLYVQGDAGIGTTNVSARLHLSGSTGSSILRMQSPSANTLAFNHYSGYSTLRDITLSNNRLLFLDSGAITTPYSIGIGLSGTTAPAVPLHVSGTFRHDGSQYNIQLIGGSEIRGSNAVTLRGLNSYAAILAAGSIFHTAGTDHIFRDTNSNALVTIKQAGNVGIGVNNPSDFNSAADNLVVGTGVGSNGISIFSGTNSAGGIYFADESGSGAGNRDGVINYNHSTATMDLKTGGNQRVLSLNTGTSTFHLGDVVMENDLTVKGIVTAQEFHTEFVSASIVYSSGSTKFGDTSDDIHQFTGSLEVSGSINSANIRLDVPNLNLKIGNTATLSSVTGAGQYNTAIGQDTGQNLTTGYNFTGLGYSAGKGYTTGNSNVSLGNYTGPYFGTSNGVQNVLVGSTIGAFMTDGASENVGVGGGSLYYNTSGAGNTALGRGALQDNATGSYNTAVGYRSAVNIKGDNNIGIGANSMSGVTLGSNNIVIGDLRSGVLGTTLNGVTAIGSGSRIDFYANSTGVGIGTTSPSDKLHVVGDVIFGNESNQKGVMTLRGDNPASNTEIYAIELERENYNPGVANAKISFFRGGSGQDAEIAFFTQESNTAGLQERLRITEAGNVGIGTTTPSSSLHVEGNVQIGSNRLKLGADNADSYIQHNGSNLITHFQSNWGGDFKFRAADTGGTQYDILFIEGSNQRVGIGTTAPAEKLEVYSGNIKLNDGSRTLIIGEEGSSSHQIKSSGYLVVDATSGIQINKTTNGNVSILNGSVGIGTSTPADSLHISQSNPGIRLSDSTVGREVDFRQVGNQFIIRDVANNASFINANLSNNPVTVESSGIWTFKKDTTIEGDLTVDGIVTAQEFHTEFVSASIVYQSGSTKFGDTSDDVHSFTGSLEVLGAINRPFSVTDGRAFHQGESGGWRLEYGFKGSSGTDRGGFGAQGGNDTVTYYYIGSTQTDPTLAATPGGNVGIGTTSPSGKLEVQTGYIISSGSGAADLGFVLDRAGLDTYQIRHLDGGLTIYNATDSRKEMTFLGNGNVGIGTNSPNAGLEIATAENSTLRLTRNSNTGNYLQLQGGSSGAIYNINTSGTQDHIFQTGGNEKMRLTSAGDLGIGTTSPSYKLTVGDSSGGDGTTAGIAGFYGQHASSPGLLQVNYDTDGSGETSVKFGGNGMIAGRGGIFNFNTSGRDISFAVNNEGNANVSNAALYISSSGDAIFQNNVGIGTTSPSSRLHVSGTADVMLIEGSGSTANTSIFAIDGNNGRLFEVSDDLSDSLFSVNTIAGLPVMEVFSDNRVTMGAFNQNDLVISGSKVGIGTTNLGTAKVVIDHTNTKMLELKRNGATKARFIADSNNGQLDLYDSSTVNSVRLLSSGNSYFNGGNVGIGTTSPDSLLEIYSDSTTDFLKLTSGGTSASPIKLIFEKTTAEQGIIEYNRNGDLEIYNTDGDGGVMLNGRNSEAGDLYVADGGNVGIGLTAPAETLHLSGSMRIDGAGTGTVQEQGGTPDTAYTNSSETNFYMGAPDRYLKIVLDGTTYLIPAYTPA